MSNFQRISAMLLPAILLVALGCSRGVVYEQHQAIPDEGWPQHQVLTFQAEVNDTTSLHQLFLNVRNTTDYPYSNLFIFMDIEFPGGTILRDTIECILADRAGQWTGTGFGAIRTNSFLFRDDVWFPETGTYTFYLQQAMRQEVLQGVADMGIRIERK
jgi:gliding motility-associated lipoprotein GldH